MYAVVRFGPPSAYGLGNWSILLLGVLALSSVCNAVAIRGADTIKVMVVGNSISHGYEADYTWRYRIWQWFKTNEVPVEFVGPYRGTSPPDMAEHLPLILTPDNLTSAVEEPKTNGRYAADVSPDFNGKHFSIWGFQTAQAKGRIRAMTATYLPDIILVELGFNDLGWFVNGPEGTLADMKTLVQNARAAKSAVRFAIANVPQRTFIPGRGDLPISTRVYNSMLAAACTEWSTNRSPVKLVNLRESYECDLDDCPGGRDGLHPNALGEFQIAKAYSQTLHGGYGLGHGVLKIPDEIPIRPCPAPRNFKLSSVASGVVATWDHSFGAYGYYAYNRAVGAPHWEGTNTFNTKNRSDHLWFDPRLEWEYKIQADCGSDVLSKFTDVRRAFAGTRHQNQAGDQKPLLAGPT